MEDKIMSQLNDILNNIDEKQLKRLIAKIQETHEYDILKQKTQIKNSAVENNTKLDKSLTNRQKHTYQVSEVAYTMVKESGMSEKEALVARLVGLCHDLGHTPFGHDGENMFSEKTGIRFNHAKYGAKVFDKIFKEILLLKSEKTAEKLFDKETIENFNGLRKYIKAGINFHADCYYMFKLDKQLKEMTSQEQELLEIAIKNPSIQAGMLADTVAFMQSDVRDLLMSENPFDNSKTVISIEDQLEVAERVGFTKECIELMQQQLLTIGKTINIHGLDERESLKKILETLGDTSIIQIQRFMAINIGKEGLNKEGRFESISDEYKLLLDDNEQGYREYREFKGENKDVENWEEFRTNQLAEQRKNLMERNPLLCLTYEIQNYLIYGKILSQENIKLLNNDVERNRSIFSRVYDYLYEVTDKPSSELRVDEIDIRKQMIDLKKDGIYPKQFKEKSEDGTISRKAVITNLVIYRMQQMGNKELKDFYQERIASREKSIEVEIDTLEQEGKTDDEIVNILQGVNIEEYSEFKRKDAETKQQMVEYRDKTEQEISSELNLEKRDIDEIKAGKSTLSRNLEYNMTYKELKQVTDNLGKSELDEKSDMASFDWSDWMSEGEKANYNMEKLIRNALAYENITESDVRNANHNEQFILNRETEKEGVSQR